MHIYKIVYKKQFNKYKIVINEGMKIKNYKSFKIIFKNQSKLVTIESLNNTNTLKNNNFTN